MNPADIQQLIDVTYIAAAIGFIFAIKWLSSPVSAMRGVLIGEIASAIAVTATLFDPQVTHYKWIIITLIIGAGRRRSPRHGEDDRGSPANRPQPRFWRAFRRTDRHRGILRRRSQCSEIPDGRNRPRSHHRLAHLHRQHDRRRQTARNGFLSAPSPTKARTTSA